MKIIAVGDVHGDYYYLKKIIKQQFTDKKEQGAIIQVGDFGVFENNIHNMKFDIPVFFIDGNHENFSYITKLVNNNPYNDIISLPPPHARNCHYITRGTSSKIISGFNTLFIGGAHSVDRKRRKENISWWRQESITEKDIKKCLLHDKIDIIISHACPYEFKDKVLDSIPLQHRMIGNDLETDNHENEKKLSILLKHFKPKLWIFGHYHANYNNKFIHEDGSETEYICLDVNYGLDVNEFISNINI